MGGSTRAYIDRILNSEEKVNMGGELLVILAEVVSPSGLGTGTWGGKTTRAETGGRRV